ncbi:redoxin domain-containing protein [Pseudoluteimonas lycopersici]|uniref:Redoxin domain-containing protein n=1 Tax=Pseudoluteimonas lycopersici TaxID=1324796 RepID=A0A516V866_9GAMM|nr:TlpA disulfide reductase family protein [Lysobacter lycopersici]QDQ74664.1 redoxin domain-containing protein [Lysobacter lycopersici]
MIRSTALRLCLPLLFAVIVLPGCKREQPQPAPKPTAPVASTPKPAAPANVDFPTLKLTTVDGKAWDLAAQRGQWVVVNFWATWCGPCLKEMPELSALDAMREHVEVIGLDYEDIEPDALKAFLKQHPVVYPIAIVDVYDPPKDFEAPRGLPNTYLIAPDGKVARRFLGPITAKDIDDAIAKAGGPPLPKAG